MACCLGGIFALGDSLEDMISESMKIAVKVFER
jgi:hypothetical protein